MGGHHRRHEHAKEEISNLGERVSPKFVVGRAPVSIRTPINYPANNNLLMAACLRRRPRSICPWSGVWKTRMTCLLSISFEITFDNHIVDVDSRVNGFNLNMKT